MLGFCGSLSLPSLLLPLDPVTRRRLCVRGAITAAARESIQICVCVLLVLSEPSNFTVAIRVWLLAFLACLCSRNGEYSSNSGNTSDTSVRSRAEHPRKVLEKKRVCKGRHGEPPHKENRNNNNTAIHGGSQTHTHMQAEIHHSATPFKVLPKQSASDTVIRHTLPVHRRGNDADTKELPAQTWAAPIHSTVTRYSLSRSIPRPVSKGLGKHQSTK
ncbi:hypothetical protein TCDM_11926 [Trypanosoma cruzi Dm28c]|uniref:Uncharacterized protein n=1 Tax=Trypanosoma cruzi Dm28c TaxID=1416333 RepID=V5CZB5_TRYCR|nr:hypothetical protein TCDM_11926 [Trypanosoma cruzi Dm28c]